MLAPKPGGGIGGVMKSSLTIAGMRNQHMAADSAQHMWTQLDVAIHQIFTQQTSSLSFNQLYNYGYQLVIHKHGHLVYEGVANSVRQHLQSKALVVLAAANETLLKSIKAIWEEFKVMSHNLHDILMYVDKNYAKAHKPKPLPVFLTLAVQIFREVIVLNSEVQGRLRQILLEEVHKERQGMLIDRELMKAVLTMLTEMGPDGTDVYEDFFEQHFLSSTRSYYKQLSQEYLAVNTCQDYMKMAEARLAEEAERVSSYVSAASEQKLKHVVQHELVMTHAKTLIEMESSGCMAMFNDNKTDDLKRMYTLFLPMPQALDLLRDFMFGYVRQLGHKIVSDQETSRDPLTFVRQMLDLKSRLDHVINTSFRGEKRAQKKLKEAFEDFVNKDTRCAQHIASYVDDLLKGGLRECTEEAADEQLDRVIVLFRYLTDKDVFESYYKQHLSKRLLGGKSVSDELEKSMIAKLKVECGYQFTTKMEGMTQDMQLTRGIEEEFKRSEAYRECPIEFGISLLRQGHWPYSTHSIAIRLPDAAQRCVDIFTRDYASKNEGRKLTWMPQLGTADIKATFPHGRHELSVSSFQMCVLMCFNEGPGSAPDRGLTYRALMATLGVEDSNDLQPHVLGLCSPKLKIILREGPSKHVGLDDILKPNPAFKSKFKRIKVPIVTIKDSAAAGGEGEAGKEDGPPSVPEGVEEERKHLIEAAIVRIMKTRKIFSHNELVAEVTKQLSARFLVQPPFIKKRIESLIERDYLTRDRDDARLYRYVA